MWVAMLATPTLPPHEVEAARGSAVDPMAVDPTAAGMRRAHSSRRAATEVVRILAAAVLILAVARTAGAEEAHMAVAVAVDTVVEVAAATVAEAATAITKRALESL